MFAGRSGQKPKNFSVFFRGSVRRAAVRGSTCTTVASLLGLLASTTTPSAVLTAEAGDHLDQDLDQYLEQQEVPLTPDEVYEAAIGASSDRPELFDAIWATQTFGEERWFFFAKKVTPILHTIFPIRVRTRTLFFTHLLHIFCVGR